MDARASIVNSTHTHTYKTRINIIIPNTFRTLHGDVGRYRLYNIILRKLN